MNTTVPPSRAAVADAATEDKTVAILCYVTILGFIAAIFMQQSHKTQLGAFHLRQMLGMVLTGVVGRDLRSRADPRVDRLVPGGHRLARALVPGPPLCAQG